MGRLPFHLTPVTAGIGLLVLTLVIILILVVVLSARSSRRRAARTAAAGKPDGPGPTPTEWAPPRVQDRAGAVEPVGTTGYYVADPITEPTPVPPAELSGQRQPPVPEPDTAAAETTAEIPTEIATDEPEDGVHDTPTTATPQPDTSTADEPTHGIRDTPTTATPQLDTTTAEATTDEPANGVHDTPTTATHTTAATPELDTATIETANGVRDASTAATPQPAVEPEPHTDTRLDPADARDRLLRVLLTDPERALTAVDDLESCLGQLARLHESVDYQLRQLANVARRLRGAGLTPAQVARLAGLGEGELVSLLAEHAPTPAPIATPTTALRRPSPTPRTAAPTAAPEATPTRPSPTPRQAPELHY
jgi:hypothetical protein